MWAAGDVVVLRETWRGRVFEARPAIVVVDRADHRAFYIPPGAILKSPVDGSGTVLRLPHGRWSLADRRRGPTHWLSFAWPDVSHAALLRWDEEGTFLGWYVNLQTPLAQTGVGFDFTDHFLDLIVDPDGTWSWKDEDELDDAITRGLFTEDDAAWFRYWGERAVEHVLLREPPFDEDWSSWRPDPAWAEPILPEDWDLAPA